MWKMHPQRSHSFLTVSGQPRHCVIKLECAGLLWHWTQNKGLVLHVHQHIVMLLGSEWIIDYRITPFCHRFLHLTSKTLPSFTVPVLVNESISWHSIYKLTDQSFSLQILKTLQ